MIEILINQVERWEQERKDKLRQLNKLKAERNRLEALIDLVRSIVIPKEEK